MHNQWSRKLSPGAQGGPQLRPELSASHIRTGPQKNVLHWNRACQTDRTARICRCETTAMKRLLAEPFAAHNCPAGPAPLA